MGLRSKLNKKKRKWKGVLQQGEVHGLRGQCPIQFGRKANKHTKNEGKGPRGVGPYDGDQMATTLE